MFLAPGVQIGTVNPGDSLLVLPTIPDRSVPAILTDIPYGIGYQSNRAKRGPSKRIIGDDAVDPRWLDDAYRILANPGILAIFLRWDVWSVWESEVMSRGFRILNMVIWFKANHTSGDLNGNLGYQHELIMLAVKEEREGRNLRKWKRPDNKRREGNVWHHCAPAIQDRLHPTEKPVDLLARLVVNTTRVGDVVLDPFAGSGPMMEACATTGRQYAGIELDPVNVVTSQTRAARMVQHERQFSMLPPGDQSDLALPDD